MVLKQTRVPSNVTYLSIAVVRYIRYYKVLCGVTLLAKSIGSSHKVAFQITIGTLAL